MNQHTGDAAAVHITTLRVTGMVCGGCAAHIARVRNDLNGVVHVDVHRPNEIVVEHLPALQGLSSSCPLPSGTAEHGTVGEPRHQYNWMMVTAEPAAPIEALLANHRAFLCYLERRVGDPALAEDILQDAFAKVVARPEQAPADEGIVPWFYRTLRNAAIDQFRRRGAADRAYEAFARELETHDAPSDDMQTEICACVSRLAATLKPEYAEALTAIEVGGTPVKVFAEQKGLSSSNAAVRVFRAREALRKRVTESCGTCAEHGCANCTCRH